MGRVLAYGSRSPWKEGGMDKLRILIVDDHAAVRERIRLLLDGQPDMEVVGEAAGGEEGVVRAVQLRPEVVLFDIAMPGMNGIEATRQIKRVLPDAHVLAVTMYDDEEFYFALVRAGGSGYIRKDAEPEELLRAIRAVREGQVLRSPRCSRPS